MTFLTYSNLVIFIDKKKTFYSKIVEINLLYPNMQKK